MMSAIPSHLMGFFSIIMCVKAQVASKAPVLRIEPEQPAYFVEESVILRCVTVNPLQVESYSFYKDGEEIFKSIPSNVLQKSSLTKTDSGTYFCTYVDNTKIKSAESNTIQLTIVDRPESPSISVEPQSPFFFVGQMVILRCLLQTRSGVTAITLYHNGNEVTESDNFGVLTFNEVQQRNAGNYTCAFKIPLSGREAQSYFSAAQQLIVAEPLPTPTLYFDLNNPQTVGTEVQLICQTPLPSTVNGYRFYQNGKEVTEKLGSQVNVFTIQNYSQAFEGCYFCKTFRIQFGQEIPSTESFELFLTAKETGGRQCKNMDPQKHSAFPFQVIKLYGSVLLGKLLVLIFVMIVFGVQILQLKKRTKKNKTQAE
ncbi:immunoglobulin superfamily member 1-like [Spea bombifrons]|uniref:immunoglobulin superfamily member 1-like n=1 Tax=Spea bombifrons TaxID=233779 RepID=UPI00234B3C18|nr:immunoglobulin superfamily member 1-like [Spea bombifrons]